MASPYRYYYLYKHRLPIVFKSWSSAQHKEYLLSPVSKWEYESNTTFYSTKIHCDKLSELDIEIIKGQIKVNYDFAEVYIYKDKERDIYHTLQICLPKHIHVNNTLRKKYFLYRLLTLSNLVNTIAIKIIKLLI